MLTVTQLASRWGMHRRTILNWIYGERLAAIKTPGGHYRIPWQAVKEVEGEWIQEQEGLHQRSQ